MDEDEIDIEDGTVNESEDEREEGDEAVTEMDDGEEQEDDEEDEEEDEDEDEDGDDDDDEEEEEDDEDDDDDEDDEDDEDEGEDEEDEDAEMAEARADRGASPSALDTSPSSYMQRAIARRALLRPTQASLAATSYSIEPVGAAPHVAHVHAMAISGDGSVLLSGGSDGHVRRYDVYASMNSRSMLTQNVRHQFVDGVVRGGVLHSWWANEEVPLVKSSSKDNDDFDEEDRLVSPVHSLALQQDALWSLTGTESGNINLCSVRHEPGQIRHILRKHTSAVSSLALTDQDTQLVSGGWDRSVHVRLPFFCFCSSSFD